MNTTESVTFSGVTLRPLPPEEIARRQSARQEAQDIARERETMRLRSAWCAPLRHAEATPQFTGQWNDRFLTISGKLGSGFLSALTGTRGNGKTQLAVELMKLVTARQKAALYATATDFFVRIKETYRKDSTRTEADILRTFRLPRLLVIDEVGKRSDSQWENNLLFELINRRYNDLTDTLLIDNRPPADFIQSIGPSLASRMQETGGIIECNWPSFREAKP